MGTIFSSASGVICPPMRMWSKTNATVDLTKIRPLRAGTDFWGMIGQSGVSARHQLLHRRGEGGEVDAFDGGLVFLQARRAAEDGGEDDDRGGREE
jgi:hypothetical protein